MNSPHQFVDFVSMSAFLHKIPIEAAIQSQYCDGTRSMSDVLIVVKVLIV